LIEYIAATQLQSSRLALFAHGAEHLQCRLQHDHVPLTAEQVADCLQAIYAYNVLAGPHPIHFTLGQFDHMLDAVAQLLGHA
jgi:hypothetical protein